MKLGNLDIQNVKLGGSDINKVMLGSLSVWERNGGEQPSPEGGWRFFRWNHATWSPPITEIQVLEGDTNVALGQSSGITSNIALTGIQMSALVNGDTTTVAVNNGNIDWLQIELPQPTTANLFRVHLGGWSDGSAQVSADGQTWMNLSRQATILNVETFNVPTYN